MFVVYLLRELRRRARQALFIALGLAVGVALVISVTAASAGVKTAQHKVLQSLYGVGTDITVTSSPTADQGGPFGFRVQSGQGDQTRPKAGTTFSRDDLRSMQLGTVKASSVSDIAAMNGVAAATGVLTLTDTHVSGKVPNASSFSNGGAGGGGPPVVQGNGSGTQTFNSNFDISSFTVTGVPVTGSALGTLSSATLKTGRTFQATDETSNVAIVTADYAKTQKLSVGSHLTASGKTFTVIGIVTVPRGATSTNVYIPLARAQKLSGLTNEVNTIYVSATKNTAVSTVAHEIKKALPKATVTTSSDLANQVSGSLSSASSLANNLGKWLSIAVLIAAFLLASLLTLSAVSRRVREFGTLKALGWRSRRVVAQVLGESLTIGAIGAALGVGLGFIGARVITAVAPALTATTSTTPSTPTGGGPITSGPAGGPPGGGFFSRASDASHTVAVHLSAAVSVRTVLLAVILALAGGLLAGALGGWRAARLRPAAALTSVA
jgi:putative ABC transport system permease protein